MQDTGGHAVTRTIAVQGIEDRRRETQSILRQAEKRGKKPVRKIDMWAVRYIVREKRKDMRNVVIAGIPCISVRHLQRIWKKFKHSIKYNIQYLPKTLAGTQTCYVAENGL